MKSGSDIFKDNLKLPCGQCIGCRLERSRQWAIRCVHESQMHQQNCFITLTYNDQNLPVDRSLNLRHFQLFMKRLRKKYGAEIRFFHCGEYGEKYSRPHYHACLFNFDFSDKIHWKTVNGFKLYTSQSLADLWGYGFCSIGDVTFESAAYVARYIMKKVTGKNAEQHYSSVDPETGEITCVSPEYTTMSRRPGIGKLWFDKYSSDVYPKDFVVLRGRKLRAPKYYDSLLLKLDPWSYDDIKETREITAKSFALDNTPERLKVRMQCKIAQISQLKRTLD